jgi:hypothetical protein
VFGATVKENQNTLLGGGYGKGSEKQKILVVENVVACRRTEEQKPKQGTSPASPT